MGIILWYLQRLTSIVMAAYATHIYTYFSSVNIIDYVAFKAFFSSPFSGALFLITLFSISIHASIGVWAIATDYLKCKKIRILFLFLYNLSLFWACISSFICIVRLA